MRRLRGEVFPPGHRIIERGRFVTHLHFIIDGKVTLSYIDSQRYEHDIATLSNGSFYGEHQILLGIKSLFRLRVPPNGKVVTQIQKLRDKDLLELQREYPKQLAYIIERSVFRMAYWRLETDIQT